MTQVNQADLFLQLGQVFQVGHRFREVQMALVVLEPLSRLLTLLDLEGREVQVLPEHQVDPAISCLK